MLKAPTTAGPVWLKASAGSSLFTDEGAVMALLADWFPADLPAPLCWDGNGASLCSKSSGQYSTRTRRSKTQEQVLVAFARLQATTAGRVDALRTVGLQERGPDPLATDIAAWLPDLGATAKLPGLDTESWLSDHELAALHAALPRILALCRTLAAGPLPATLLHGDLHMGNVAVGPSGWVLFDWTDASIGHSFFDPVTALHGSEASCPIARCVPVRLERLRIAAPLAEIWRAVEVPGPLHHAVSYGPPPRPALHRWIRRWPPARPCGFA